MPGIRPGRRIASIFLTSVVFPELVAPLASADSLSNAPEADHKRRGVHGATVQLWIGTVWRSYKIYVFGFFDLRPSSSSNVASSSLDCSDGLPSSSDPASKLSSSAWCQ